MTQRIILMTGATGFIGRELGLALVQRGYVMRAVTRDPERVQGTLPFPAELVPIGENHAIDAAKLEGLHAVVALAGESVGEGTWTSRKKHKIRSSRIDASTALVNTLVKLRSKPKVLVQASAVGFYGDRGDELLDEQASRGSGFLADVCEDWEHAAQRAATAGLRVVTPRFGLVLGRSGGSLPVMASMYTRGLGGVLGSGKQWMSWIHIEDLVRMLVQAVEDEKWSGVFNAVAPEPCRNRDFHEAFNRALRMQGNKPAPASALELLLGERASLLLASQRVVPRKAVQHGFTHLYKTIDEALQALYAEALEPGVTWLIAKQWLAQPLAKVWPYFCESENLAKITPPAMRFQVLASSTQGIEQGTVIDYRFRLRGIPLRWTSLIREWTPQHSFVDEQIHGPYKLWHHRHLFQEVAGGTLITDEVQYRLPLPPLGSIFAGALVGRDVGRIFKFRAQTIARMFNGSSSARR